MAASSSRGAAAPGSDAFLSRLDRESRDIDDPVAKLKHIRGSLERYRRLEARIAALPYTSWRRILARAFGVDAIRPLLEDAPDEGAPLSREALRRLMLARLAQESVTMAAVVMVLLAVAVFVQRSRPQAAGPALADAAGVVAGTGGAAAPAVVPVAGLAPNAVWLVEKGPGWEQYSNGLRVETGFSVAGDPRRYQVFSEESGAGTAVRHEPVGILFHTTESDVWPLEAAYNETLRDSSHKLLRYVSRGRLYHYLIDRFGRVYRLVEEETKANHAGNSVWAQGRDIYVGLNQSFLGVAFETRWEGGRALPITQAQFSAGRNLTDYLRQKWQIAPEMCVGHGLASVNPKKRLIGHHLDWARGFPFEAFGLPDQYNRLAPSVAVFGFGYDED
ncbi:MAG TPA: peptidoglycan recognition family protein, partial [Vicinamibacteria bacterium]|nr:peptidoglycan recognition family protein [Vicinamibacteria bacterium]